MKHSLFNLLILFLCLQSFGSTHTLISGGLSTKYGNNSSQWYPGFNGAFTVLGKPVEYVGICGDASYTRWGSKEGNRSLHYVRLQFLFELCYPVHKNFAPHLDIGDGICGKMFIDHDALDGKDETTISNSFMFGGGAILFQRLSLVVRSNYVFSGATPDKWININLGFYY